MNRKLDRIKGAGALAATSTTAALMSALPAHAQIDRGIQAGNVQDDVVDVETVVQRVINILLFVVGAASVIMLIIGGIRYVVSAGDQNAVTGAKNTILYALVGVGIALIAYVAVDFVFRTLTDT